MDSIVIEATKRTPAIHFDFQANQLTLSGESYPEDVNAFYGNIMDSLKVYLEQSVDKNIIVSFDLVYFNSSSAKVLIRMFDMLDEAAKQNRILVEWFFLEDDDNMAELGEEFGEDLENAEFKLTVKISE